MKRGSDLFTVYGVTDGAGATGTFDLYSDLYYSTVDNIRIPRGMVLKIWGIRANRNTVDVIVKFTQDVTAAIPTYITMDRTTLSDTIEYRLNMEKRRPMVFRGKTGDEAVAFDWAGSAPAVSDVEFDIEICKE